VLVEEAEYEGYEAAVKAALNAAGAYAIAAAALSTHVNDHQVARAALQALGTLTAKSTNNTQAGVASVLEATRLYQADPPMAALACKAIEAVAGSSEATGQALVDGGAAPLVIDAMRLHATDRHLVVCGTRALAQLTCCVNIDDCAPALVAAGACEAVIAAMAAYPQNWAIALYGTDLLRVVVWTDEGRGRLQRIGGDRAAMDAMEAHRYDADVQRAGVYMLLLTDACDYSTAAHSGASARCARATCAPPPSSRTLAMAAVVRGGARADRDWHANASLRVGAVR
jgi:hypothetical protein